MACISLADLAQSQRCRVPTGETRLQHHRCAHRQQNNTIIHNPNPQPQHQQALVSTRQCTRQCTQQCNHSGSHDHNHDPASPVDAQDLGACVLIGVWELDLTIQASTAHQGWVQDVSTVGGSNDLQAYVHNARSRIRDTQFYWVAAPR